MFRRARQNRIYEDVVEQIQTAILEGNIPEGERLPSERDLCDQLQTSRGTLREALRILEQKGLVDIRLGANGGAYVKGTNNELMAENLAMLLKSNVVTLEHLEEFRENLEGSVAFLAAKRVTADGKRELAALLDKAKKLNAQGLGKWDEFVRVDEQVHVSIARASANPLYNFVLSSIHANIHQFYNTFLSVTQLEMDENYADLAAVVQAICNGEAQEAEEKLRQHVHRFAGYMRAKNAVLQSS